MNLWKFASSNLWYVIGFDRSSPDEFYFQPAIFNFDWSSQLYFTSMKRYGGFLSHRATPRSSIFSWDSSMVKPTSYWIPPWSMGHPHDQCRGFPMDLAGGSPLPLPRCPKRSTMLHLTAASDGAPGAGAWGAWAIWGNMGDGWGNHPYGSKWSKGLLRKWLGYACVKRDSSFLEY